MTDTKKLPADWAIKKAIQRLPFKNYWSVEEVKRRSKDDLEDNSRYIIEIAKVIEEHEQPPVSQELLIWREAKALFEEDLGLLENVKKFREGLLDHLKVEQGSMVKAIELALKGFGKEGAS